MCFGKECSFYLAFKEITLFFETFSETTFVICTVLGILFFKVFVLLNYTINCYMKCLFYAFCICVFQPNQGRVEPTHTLHLQLIPC